MSSNHDDPPRVGRHAEGQDIDPRTSHRQVKAVAENVRAILAEQPSARSLRAAEQRLHRLVSFVADEVISSRKGEA